MATDGASPQLTCYAGGRRREARILPGALILIRSDGAARRVDFDQIERVRWSVIERRIVTIYTLTLRAGGEVVVFRCSTRDAERLVYLDGLRALLLAIDAARPGMPVALAASPATRWSFFAVGGLYVAAAAAAVRFAALAEAGASIRFAVGVAGLSLFAAGFQTVRAFNPLAPTPIGDALSVAAQLARHGRREEAFGGSPHYRAPDSRRPRRARRLYR
ncbi:MAG: hypothetical protein AAGC56_11615 [Pseudomonadota bacterium]